MEPVYVAITMEGDEPLRILSFERGPMRGPVLPFGAVWDDKNPGFWTREATAETLAHEVRRSCPLTSIDGAPLPRVVSWRTVSRADLPTTREYRDAWSDAAGAIVHDMTKAKAIHREKLRAARVEALVKLDQEWFIAERAKDNQVKDAIDAKKQAMLDVTDDPRIDAAQTIAELAAVTLPT